MVNNNQIKKDEKEYIFISNTLNEIKILNSNYQEISTIDLYLIKQKYGYHPIVDIIFDNSNKIKMFIVLSNSLIIQLIGFEAFFKIGKENTFEKLEIKLITFNLSYFNNFDIDKFPIIFNCDKNNKVYFGLIDENGDYIFVNFDLNYAKRIGNNDVYNTNKNNSQRYSLFEIDSKIERRIKNQKGKVFIFLDKNKNKFIFS